MWQCLQTEFEAASYSDSRVQSTYCTAWQVDVILHQWREFLLSFIRSFPHCLKWQAVFAQVNLSLSRTHLQCTLTSPSHSLHLHSWCLCWQITSSTAPWNSRVEISKVLPVKSFTAATLSVGSPRTYIHKTQNKIYLFIFAYCDLIIIWIYFLKYIFYVY